MGRVGDYSDYTKASRPRRLWSGWLITLLLLSAAAWTLKPRDGTWFPLHGRSQNEPNKPAPFSWDDIESKPYLDYVDCYDGEYQCARLELPMDYWNGTTDATISLAVIRKPAVVPVTHPQYGGATLHNPGGPGGSGVDYLMRAGKHIRETIDDEYGLHFDMISFDPRGISRSKPAVQCFKDLRLDESWQVRVMEEGVFDSSDAALGRLWSMGIARSASCSLPPADGGPDIKKYVSTPSVARDMLEIVERHGEWREREAKRLLQHEESARGFLCAKHVKPALEVSAALKYKPGEEKINYWGFSYGSYLGNTFAAMFPDRIHRLVVDGVVDAENYKKMLWSDNLEDTEKDMDLFYYHCARVGFPTCALANTAGTTSKHEVKKRVQNITTHLIHNPLPVIAPNPEVITYSDVKNVIFAGLYSPLQSFPYIANLLAGVERGDGTEFAKLLRQYHTFQCPAQPDSGFSITPLRNRTNGDSTGMSYDATMAISCSDGDDQSWVTKAKFEKHAKSLAKTSPSIGEMWATVRMLCIHYSIRPYHRFEGPWVGNTSHPILEIGNTADPVTPGAYAKKMAKGFTGAVALIQNSAGHCSPSTPSKCTEAYVRRYFQTGELPSEGTVCEADVLPFGPGPEDSDVLDVEAAKVRERQNGIAQALFATGGGSLNTGRIRGSVPWY